MAKENWYRTGAVADETGISQYKLRTLAKRGLIESRFSNGMLYIPGTEVERLKTNGPPPMPAKVCDELPGSPGHQDADDELDSVPVRRAASSAPTRNRPAEQLYAAPSRQLAKSKERVIRLEHTVEAKRLQQQGREIDRLAKEERARADEARVVRQWRDGYIRRVLENLPGELCADTCAAIEALLERVPPGSNVTAKVDEIIHKALQPIRRREDQARAVDEAMSHLHSGARRSESENRVRSQALRVVLQLPEHANYADMLSAARAVMAAANAAFYHFQRIEREVSWLGTQLPISACGEDVEEAGDLARRALNALPLGATDRQFKSTIQSAIAPMVSRMESRTVQEDRDRAEKQHLSRIEAEATAAFLFLPARATSEERAMAERRVRAALEQLPPTASISEIDAAKERQLAPIKAAIQKREQVERLAEAARQAEQRKTAAAEHKADSALSSVEKYLREYFDFDSPFDVYRESRELKDRLRPQLIRKIQSGRVINDTQIERWVRTQIENS